MLQTFGTRAGKITVTTILASIFVMAFVFFFDVQHGGRIQTVAADTATTSVTVVNTPPAWTQNPIEVPASTTTSPTNVGTQVTWQAIGTDGNGEDYYLLICKDNAAPTPNAGAAPNCNGAGQWAVSTSTASGASSTASYTVTAVDGEEAWYAWICDGNVGTPSCNGSFQQGSGDNGSPFNSNQRPTFTVFTDTSPVSPGGTVTWNTTASDPEGYDIQLFVCTTNAFTAGVGCDVGTWATSTAVASDPSANTTISIPYQDGTTTAYGFIQDEFLLAASGGAHGSDSALFINNVAPTVSTSSVSIEYGSDIVLAVEEGETPNITITFTVDDDNSCQNQSAGDEITDVDVNLYRSALSGACSGAGDYNAENCYTEANGNWTPVCAQHGGSCTGSSDPDAVWTCTTTLWYIADATDVGSEYPGENWLASARATDDNAVTGTYSEGDTGEELLQFLAFDLATSSITYGALQPGQNNNPAPPRTVDLKATGNVGIDLVASGTDMCPTYPTCSGQGTSTIFVYEQRYSLSSTTWAAGSILTSTTSPETEINIPKTSATSTPAASSTYWGINVPGIISVSGDYTGENFFIGVVSEVGEW